MPRNRKPSLRLSGLFREAYAVAKRAAEVRSANAIGVLRDAALDREDLTQDVLVGIWAALPSFDHERASLRTFIEGVAKRTIASRIRSTRALKRTKPDLDPPTESLRSLLSVEYRVDVERVLGKLGPRDQQVAWLLMDCRPAQIARRLNISRTAVYRSIGRIRAALRQGGFGS